MCCSATSSESELNHNVVLLFPPLSSFRRFLIHQLVQNSFAGENLETFSIGKDSGRRTVVCSGNLLRFSTHLDDHPATFVRETKMITMVTNKETVKQPNASSRRGSNGTSSSRTKSMPPLTIYRPPAARNESLRHSLEQQSPPVSQNTHVVSVTAVNSQLNAQFRSSQPVSQVKKVRRPDQLMYVPRPRRSEIRQQISNLKPNSESTPQKHQSSLIPIVHPRISPPAMTSESISNRGVFNGKLNVSSCNELTNMLKLKENSKIDSWNSSLHSSRSMSSESLQELQKNCSRRNSLISSDELNSDVQKINCDFGHRRSSVELNDSISCVMSSSDEQEIKRSTRSLYDSLKVELNDSIRTVTQGGQSDSLNGSYNADSSFKKLNTSTNCDIEITPFHDSNNERNNSGDVILDSTLQPSCKSEEHDVSPAKRKEICESETNEDTVDHKSKQIHLINDSSIEEPLCQSDCSLNLNESTFSVTSSVDENLLPDKKTKTIEHQNCSKLNLDECDWESLFDDEGNCLEPLLLDELSKSVGKVKVTSAPSDYRSFQSTEERTNDGECIVEIYGFPAEFKTRDLLNVFAAFRNRAGFQIKWVDDTHALGVFNSPLVADEVLQCELPFVKTRPLRLALPESRNKARTIPIALPPASRPKTCPALARRLVTGALGLRMPTDRKKREEEKLILKEARDQRRLAAKQREAAWEGKFGSNEVSS